MKMRLRHSNNVDLAKTFIASLRGGGRGYPDCMALETFSNDIAPTIRCVNNFTLIVEINNGKIRATLSRKQK